MMAPVATRPSSLFSQHSSPIFTPCQPPVYHPSLPPLQHAHSSSSIPVLTAHIPSSSTHPPSPAPSSTTAKSRPKLCQTTKKSSCSTKLQQTKVQMSLEAKVERCKGFHSFFVPLARSVPPPPPSSPILGPTRASAAGGHLRDVPIADYFGSWRDQSKGQGEQEWIENVEIKPIDGQMDIDA